MKKTTFAAFLFITAIIISSCGSSLRNAVTTSSKSAQTDPAITSSSNTSGPVSETTEPEITAEPVIPVPVVPEMTEPFMTLTCFDTSENINAIFDAGEGKAVLECIKDDEIEGTEPDGNAETLYLVDTLTDKILAQGHLPSYDYKEFIIGVRSNGETVTFNYHTQHFGFYDERFEKIRDLEAPESEGIVMFFRHSGSSESICYINAGRLYEIDCTTGSFSLVTDLHDTEVKIYDYDYENGLVLFSGNSDKEFYACETAVYSIKEDKLLYRFGGDASSSFFDDYLISNSFEYDENGDYIDARSFIYVRDKISGKQLNAFELSDINIFFDLYSYSTGSIIGNISYDETGMKIADFSSGRYADLDLCSDSYCYTAFSGRYLIGVTDHSDVSRSSLIVFDPSLIDFDKLFDSAALEEQIEDPSVTLPDYLSEVRSKADAIERDFSVRVLIDDECCTVKGPGDYTMESTKMPDLWAGIFTDKQKADQISQALDKLREGLSVYPEGFFKKFRNYRDAGGIRIAIPRSIFSVNDTTFVAGGVEYKHGAWYNIWIDIDEFNVTDTIHHEIWHAVEDLIQSTDYMIFTNGNWEELNPENFEYQYDLDNYYEANFLDKYLIENKNRPYFSRIYSTVNAQEDRATLIEFVLMENFGSYYSDYYGHATAYETVRSFPEMKAKLDYLEAAVEKVFGCVYWRP